MHHPKARLPVSVVRVEPANYSLRHHKLITGTLGVKKSRTSQERAETLVIGVHDGPEREGSFDFRWRAIGGAS